eukprot:TRINITY_DN627_c0_g1_i1.p1 TRINITY_DN627_c0_g1~~TRINITY_DN627_c0_g1_i1.p1  ORF type:complete len:224 (-),score=38.49 TRINITY_DN627_c0_g1_i1:8-679(-)
MDQFYILAPEIKLNIFHHLPVQSVARVLLTCLEWNQLIDDSFWKEMCHRDFLEYLETQPLSNECDPRPMIPTQERKPPKPTELNITGWKEYYRRCLVFPRIEGVWYGIYGSHGIETLNVTQKGYEASALKVTGDVNVPAGKVSWYTTFCHNGEKGWGQIQLAETGFTSPRWGCAELRIISHDELSLIWHLCEFFFGEWIIREHPLRLRRNVADLEPDESDDEE